MTIFQSIGNFFASFVKKAAPVVEDAFTGAVKITNILKTFLDSATGQTIEAIIEALAPGVSTAVIGALNVFFTDFGLVVSEVGKDPLQIAADGLNAISKLSGDSKTTALSNVSSIIAHATSTANGGTSTLQQAITVIPVVYNPAVLNDPTTASAPAPTPPVSGNVAQS